MARFLHIADIHLGFDRYNSAERTSDFFYALRDVLERYAVDAAVDFVLIAGDLFEHKQVVPGILNQAKLALEILAEANIPALAIEGNHDNLPYGTRTSWLRHLAQWDNVILLEPDDGAEDPAQIYQPWNPESKLGGYIDLDCGVRVLGSRWYGASAPQALGRLAEAIAGLPPGPAHQVMMVHHGLEGQIARYSGALRYGDLLPLRQAGVDYLALGHIHKNYTVENWIFNPGSLEANSVAESREQMDRGAYLVEIDDRGIRAELQQDYQQRPVLRFALEAQKAWTVEELAQRAIAVVQRAAQQPPGTAGAIVELRLRGQVGFNRLDLNLRALREQLTEISQALVFLLKYEVTGTEYATPLGEGERRSRQDIENIVFQDFLAANTAYEPEFLPQLTQGLISLKEQILNGQGEADLYQAAEKLLQHSQSGPPSPSAPALAPAPRSKTDIPPPS